MEKGRVFVCHSTKDKAFAILVVDALKEPKMETWIDHEWIFSGDDVFDKIGEGLSSMDIMIFLASKDSLESEWVKLEVKYAKLREIAEKKVLVLPFRLYNVQIQDLPWFLQIRNAPSVTTDTDGASIIIDRVRTVLEERFNPNGLNLPEELEFKKDPKIEELLASVKLADWEASKEAAIEMLMNKEKYGSDLFNSLLSYLNSPNENQHWTTRQILECYSGLVPEAYNYTILNQLGNNRDFSTRSTAAVICYNLAHFAPHLVPVDLVVKLSRSDEDWYVKTPAINALKTLVRWRPTILKVLFLRLKSKKSLERELAANAIYDISCEEPEIINPEELNKEIVFLEKIDDKVSLDLLSKALSNMKAAKFGSQYKYGAF